jgi:dipeptidyl-peptidase-4
MRSLFAVVAVVVSLATTSFSQQTPSAIPLSQRAQLSPGADPDSRRKAGAPAAGKGQLTIEDIFREPDGGAGDPRFVEWNPDGRHLSFIRANPTDGRDELYSLDPASGQGKALIGAAPLASLMAPNAELSERERENRARYGTALYHWSPDSKALLFDAAGRLRFYDLQSGEQTDLTGAASPCGSTRDDGGCGVVVARDPKFSPDGRYISFVRDHGLVVRPVPSGTNRETELGERRPAGAGDTVWTGEVDWVYEEELDVRSNYFWSPDSRHIAFLEMDEREVPEYPIVEWVSREVKIDRQRYPKAGERNPGVRIGVADLDGRSKWLNFTAETDIYIPRFGWISPKVVWALVLNRAQTREGLYFIDVESGTSRLVLQESDNPYIEMNDALRFSAGDGSFLWPSWRDGHTHLYLYEYEHANPLSGPARLVRQLTRGDWEVLELVALDEKAGAVYFTANKDDWRQSNLYRVKLDGTAIERLTPQNGVHRPSMPAGAEYFFDRFSALTTPPRAQLCGVKADERPPSGALETASCKELWRSKELEDADVLTPQFVDFKAEDGSLLHGVVLLPKDGPMAAGGKFPLILSVYGGPREQLVRDSWRTVSLLDQVMAQRGFAILKVDNRGSGNRGKNFAAATHGNFGAVELKDQLAALDQALARYPQLDRNRIGCWGWSFGGTLTAYALTHSVLFKAAVAVAPVADWRLYDSIYTERYLGMPRENPEGYRSSSILYAAPELSGHLLIAHGTGDDNVHVQNSLELANALISAGKAFDLQLYPGKTHAIEGVAARSDLYHRLVDQFERWLAPAAVGNSAPVR